MNNYFVFYFQLVIYFVGAVNPPANVKINIRDDGERVVVNLNKIDSYLANENLQVWTAEDDSIDSLTLQHGLMRQFGGFSTYQNSRSSSAIVFFHDESRFYGTVDVRYSIGALSMADVTGDIKHKISIKAPGVLARRNCISKPHERNSETVMELASRTNSNVQSRQTGPVYYLQLLLIVSHDLVQKLEGDSVDNNRLLIYLLTLFNSVDMLFSKINEPNIRINIAGIIIMRNSETFAFWSNCHYKNHSKNINAKCITYALSEYLSGISNVISPTSYDVSIFLTRHHLLQRGFLTDKSIGGMTRVSKKYTIYKLRKKGIDINPTISVRDFPNFGSFHMIAHELVHSLRLFDHDKVQHTENGDCCSYLMKPVAEFCENCLWWSPRTMRYLKNLFRTRERCFYVKAPRSLARPGPRELWTADELCRCYGYRSISTRNTSSCLPAVRRTSTQHICKRKLICVDEDGKCRNAPRPLDGMKCGDDRVCWNRECVSIERDEALNAVREVLI